MDEKPILNKNIKVDDFKNFYWLKKELVIFCKTQGLPTSGGKMDIADRIEKYLMTGKIEKNKIEKPSKPASTFNWNSGHLTLNTKITDNYKNTQNVRSFFTEHIGKQFKFNVKFMNWIKENTGKNLNDAIIKWKEIQIDNKNRTADKDIAPQFEYNRYIRDFLRDNPDLKHKDAVKHWKIKRNKRGDNSYNKSDLNLK